MILTQHDANRASGGHAAHVEIGTLPAPGRNPECKLD